jgi:hypothetical protein
MAVIIKRWPSMGVGKLGKKRIGISGARMLLLVATSFLLFGSSAPFFISSIPASGEDIVSLQVGTTYYVDSSSGSDSSSGTSTTSSWGSISKVNQQKFSAGDSVLFKRGSIFSSTLSITYSGTATNPITYGDYGTGSKPVFDLNGAKSHGISIISSGITLKNLVVKNAGSQGILIENPNNGVYNIQILDCEAYNIGANGILYSYGGGNVTIMRFVCNNTANSGIALMGSYTRRLNNVLVEDCWISNSTSNDGITIHEGDSTPKTPAGSNFRLIGNHVQYSAEDGYDITTGNHILLLNNTSTKNQKTAFQLGHSAYDVEIVGHHSWDEGTWSTSGSTVCIWISDVFIHDSVFEGGDYHTFYFCDPYDYKIDNITIQNNYIGWKGNRDIIWFEDPVTNLTFGNNIFYSSSTTGRQIQFSDSNYPPNHPSTVFKNNVYYSTGTFKFWDRDDGEFNLSIFKSTYGQDPKGIGSDPKLVGYSKSDFSLKSNSPAIDAGADVKQATDYVGNPIYGVRDIGAYEYQPPYKIGTDRLDIGRSIRLYSDGKYRYLDEKTSKGSSTLSIEPYNGWTSLTKDEKRDALIDVDVSGWEKTGNYSMEFNVQFAGKVKDLRYTLSNLPSDVDFEIVVGGKTIDVKKSTTSGRLSFVYNRTTSSLFIQVKRVESINLIDLSASMTTTGEDFEINYNIRDASGISGAWIRYWYEGDTSITNTTLSRTIGTPLDGIWKKTIRVRTDTVRDLIYLVGAIDLDGKAVWTEQVHVLVIDNDLPMMIGDLTPSMIGTGNDLRFEFFVSDNIGITASSVEFKIGDGPSLEVPLEMGPEIHWAIIPVPWNWTPIIQYQLFMADSSLNIYSGPIGSIQVFDDDSPYLIKDNTSDYTTTGEPLNIDFQMSDNIGLNTVNVEYWQGQTPPINRSVITTIDGVCNITIDVGENSIEDLHYRIISSDLSGNWFVSETMSVRIVDNDPPRFSLDQRGHIISKGYINITRTVTDNVGIMKVEMQYLFDAGKQYFVEMHCINDLFFASAPIPESGFKTFSYKIIAYDLFDNTKETPENILDGYFFEEGNERNGDTPQGDDTKDNGWIDLADSGSTITLKGQMEIDYFVHSEGILVSTALFMDGKLYTVTEVDQDLSGIEGEYTNYFEIVAMEISEGEHTLKVKSFFSDGHHLISDELVINVVHPRYERYIALLSFNMDQVSIFLDETFSFQINVFDQNGEEIKDEGLILSYEVDPDIGYITEDLIFHPQMAGTANITFHATLGDDTSSAKALVTVRAMNSTTYTGGNDTSTKAPWFGLSNMNVIGASMIITTVVLMISIVVLRKKHGINEEYISNDTLTCDPAPTPCLYDEIVREAEVSSGPVKVVDIPEEIGSDTDDIAPTIEAVEIETIQEIQELLNIIDVIEDENNKIKI